MFQQELSQLLSESTVISDENTLAYYNTATFKTTTKSQVVVQTNATSEIIKLLHFCTEKKLKIYVISGGKNWGLGSAVPVQDVAILLDLRKMNKIISYDSQFGTVRCEAGVTFGQLSDFLKKNGNKHFLNTIGGDANASVLGNILERGDGVGPYSERSEYACWPEVILANGEVVDIGLGNVWHSKLAELAKTGIGPSFQDIFLQSNYGIVTKVTIWLCPIPKAFRTFQFSLAETHSLSVVINQLKTLYERRVFSTPITFWNDYKQIANVIQYPWHVESNTPLSRETCKKISNNYSTWSAFGGVYIDNEKMSDLVIKEIFKSIKNQHKKRSFWSVLSNTKIKYLKLLQPLTKNTKLDFEQIINVWHNNPLLGNMSDNNTKSLFWRKKAPIPPQIDPSLYACGLLWNSFLIPFDGELIENALAEIDEIIFSYRFEPIISMVIFNDRYIRVFQQLIFDRAIDEEDLRAIKCHQHLQEYLKTAGFSHSRLDILSMASSKQILKNTSIHQEIKNALDPHDIIASGRYFL